MVVRVAVVKAYLDRKSLAHSLNDTKTAVRQLHKLASVVVIVVIIIVMLLLLGFATTQVLVFISSQLLLVVFMFGNTCKTIFEAIIFVFVMHPFDVGDRCVVDGVQVRYIDNKPKYWNPNHSIVVENIVDINKMNMALNVRHTMNFQNIVEKNNRRSDLVLELKKIFEELSIRYHLLPQEVHFSYTGFDPLPVSIGQSK
ncbi:hypothetical protein B296_00039610 [Ensete ventricosum]|uniref:Uncharacterized protein n=1 Tax=Ensete ventricosum TaxID=4639 RepID=A0A426ZSZ5_ENSVE|nr:hypothetical protein B296_00039610 [Ensete ventricosum]